MGTDSLTSGLAGIDIVIIVLYMAGVFFMGSFSGGYVKSAGDFFAAFILIPYYWRALACSCSRCPAPCRG